MCGERVDERSWCAEPRSGGVEPCRAARRRTQPMRSEQVCAGRIPEVWVPGVFVWPAPVRLRALRSAQDQGERFMNAGDREKLASTLRLLAPVSADSLAQAIAD